MKIARTPGEMQALAQAWRQEGRRIAFVPTMGALHAGHISLVRQARETCPVTVVSIFVNPLQFGPAEDLGRYPRQEEEDLALLTKEGVTVLYLPGVRDIYPDGFETTVAPGSVAEPLEGGLRPGHFSGVCTVVLKLFAAVAPHQAWFGAKDAQQLAVIRRMAIDLNLPLEIKAGATVRDSDGLALSSRNVYLSPSERATALSLSRSLRMARRAFADGLTGRKDLLAIAQKEMDRAGPELQVEYLEIRNFRSFQTSTDPVREAVMLVAAKVGKTRLIDNLPLDPEAASHLGGATP